MATIRQVTSNLIMFALLSGHVKAFDKVYGLRNSAETPPASGFNAQTLEEHGIEKVAEKALIFVIAPIPAWIEGPIFHQESEFDAWYFTDAKDTNSAVFAIPADTQEISAGEVPTAQPVEEQIDQSTVKRNYLFQDNLFSVAYRFRSNCAEKSIEYPAHATLTIQLNGKELLQRQGYHDDLDPGIDPRTGEPINCQQFIASNLRRMPYVTLDFLGDMNHDGLIDAIITVSEKFSYERFIYLGKGRNDGFVLEAFSADSYSPI